MLLFFRIQKKKKNHSYLVLSTKSTQNISEKYMIQSQDTVEVSNHSGTSLGALLFFCVDHSIFTLPDTASRALFLSYVNWVREWQSANEWWGRADSLMLRGKTLKVETQHHTSIFSYPHPEMPLKKRTAHPCPTKQHNVKMLPQLHKINQNLPRKVCNLFWCYFGWGRIESKTVNKTGLKFYFTNGFTKWERNLILCYIPVGCVSVGLKRTFSYEFSGAIKLFFS